MSSDVLTAPAVFVDRWLLVLQESELRVLLVLLRHDSLDSLSLKQLCNFTGMSKEGVQRGLRRLLARGLVVAQRTFHDHGGYAPNHYRVDWSVEPPATINKLTRSDVLWQQALDDFGHSCAYCGRSDLPLVREHVVPRSKGGKRIVPACPPCNGRKRTEDWSQHLEVLRHD